VTAAETTASLETTASQNRIAAAFARARDEGRTAIIPFVTVGYPTLARSEAWALGAIRGGADLLEIGVPFSDPLADGPTVQRTSQVALEQGTTLRDALDLTRRLRQEHGVTIPILLMGYYNPILRYGLEKISADCAEAGIDGYIVPDLPAEESDELLAAFRRHGLDLIYLLAPTSTDARIAAVGDRASGFIYCVSLTGVTGQRDSLPDLTGYLARVRSRTSVPIAIGFGVSRPEHVRQIGEVADGAVVASAMINYLDTVPEAEQAAAAERFVRAMRGEGELDASVASSPAAKSATGAVAANGHGMTKPEPGGEGAVAVDNQTIFCRGIRGATTVESDTAEDILEATTDLLEALIRLNDIRPEDVVSAVFTTTPELTAAFPALAARDLGWTEVPLLCAHEMAVPGALRGVVRILLHVNTPRTPREINHVYLGEARALRPEWAYSPDQLAEILGRRPAGASLGAAATPAASHHRPGETR
jgi:tryptophan synthase alpha chain